MLRLSVRSIGIVVAVGGLTALGSVTQTSANAPSQRSSLWHPWFEIGGYHNSRDEDSTGTSGTNRGEVSVFAPLTGNSRTLLFGQLTAKLFDDSAKEGNLAIGYRKMMPSGFNLGAWVGGDVRKTEIDNTFWQLSGGFEALSKNIDARVNWYGPVSKPQTGVAGFAQVVLSGNQIYMTGGEEVALMGVDGEIGFRVPTEYLQIKPDLFELRAYAGAYYFDNDKAENHVTGVTGRIELRVNDVFAALPGSRLTLGYEVSHDDVRDTRHDVGLRMRIPLNGGQSMRSLASLSHQQRRMLDGIERDTDIVTGRSKTESVEDALTGTDFERVAYASQDTAVERTSETAGMNALIIANGVIEGSHTLRSNQTLQGGGATIMVRGRTSGLVLPFTAPGAVADLRWPVENESTLTLAGSNIHVAGINIVGYGEGAGYGVEVGSNKTNVFLSNLDISQTGSSGIHVADNNQISILNTRISDVGGDGIAVDLDNEITITGVTITGAKHNGIDIGDRNQATLRDLQLSDVGISGVNIQFDNQSISIDQVTIENAGSIGIFIHDSNAAPISITNADIAGAGVSGIYIGDNNTNIKIANVSISDVDESGIYIVDGNKVEITGTLIQRTGEHGIESYQSNTIIIANSTLSDIGKSAVYNYGGSTLLIANTMFTGAIAEDIFNFAYGTVAVEDGSIGNVNDVTSLGGRVCRAESGGAFTGTIELSGTVLIDDDGGPDNCN